MPFPVFQRLTGGLLPLLLLLSGCGLFRGAAGGPAAEREAQALLRKTEAASLDFGQLSLSGRARLEMPGSDMENLSVTYRVHIAKDSLMLIRVIKFAEALRILVRPDSIFVLNKLDQTLTVVAFDAAETYTGLPADFGLLQDLLLGNFHPLPATLQPESRSGNPRRFLGESAGTRFIYSIDPQLHKLTGIEAHNEARNQQTAITYGDFTAEGGTQVPQTGKVAVLQPAPFSVEFEHKKIQIDPGDLSFSFSVPEGYQRREGP